MGIRKQTAFRNHQPNISMTESGKPYSICPVCRKKINVATTRCTHCGTLIGIKND